MTLIVRRLLLVVLLVTALLVGGWAYAMPHHWFDTFPGFGMQWVVPFGPYNEHLVKDVGAMYLGLAVLTAAALWSARNDATVRLTAAAWTTFNALHLGYHLSMLHMTKPSDRLPVAVSLTAILLISAAVSLPLSRRERQSTP